MNRTWIQNLRTIVQGRTANIASSTNATPIVVTRTAVTAVNVSGAAGTPILIATATAHGLSDGDMVTIASVGGNTNANADSFVLVVSPTSFQIFSTTWVPVASNSAYTSGGTVTPWLFQDGDVTTIAGHATNTNAVGTWINKSSSATVQTLVSQYDLSNSVGNGVGGATGTIVHAGSAMSSIAGLDISAITAGLASLRIRVKSLTGGNATFSLQDSVNSFTAFKTVTAREINGSGITKGADFNVVLPYREIARARFGVASSLARLRADVDTGASMTYDAFLEY